MENKSHWITINVTIKHLYIPCLIKVAPIRWIELSSFCSWLSEVTVWELWYICKCSVNVTWAHH